MKNTLFIYLIIFCASCIAQDLPSITAEDAQQKKSDPNIIFVDVRTEEEYNGPLSHVKDAILIPLNSIDKNISKLEKYKDKKLIVYCRSGKRSQSGTQILRQHGFNATNMLGGINAWNKLPVDNFPGFFIDKTMRVDYFHSGNHESEFFAIDQVYEAGPWAGSQNNLITHLNLGDYQLRIFDEKTAQLIYSRGYSSIFNEWQTTSDAKSNWHTFHETQQIPMPKAKIKYAVYRRDEKLNFKEIWSTIIDPNDKTILSKSVNKPDYKVTALMENGPPSNKVDLVIIGDGYSKDDIDQLRKDAKKYNDLMFDTEPFKSRKKEFNVWLVEVISAESGISKPDKNIWKSNALGSRYYTFRSPRYVLTENNKAVRDAAGLVPYDYINILINDNRYGGGGIYNLYATTYMRVDKPGMEWQIDYTYVHEFGHSFASLADEYYTSTISFDEEKMFKPDVEPWDPNLTALFDPKNIKWKKYMDDPDIPLPTPWEKEAYDKNANTYKNWDRTTDDYYDKREPYISANRKILEESKYAGKVGAFEGAGYHSRGLYRPSVNCRMFSLAVVPFDPVCRAAIERVIDHLTK